LGRFFAQKVLFPRTEFQGGPRHKVLKGSGGKERITDRGSRSEKRDAPG